MRDWRTPQNRPYFTNLRLVM